MKGGRKYRESGKTCFVLERVFKSGLYNHGTSSGLKRFSLGLILSHLVLEKLLKAVFVSLQQKHPPFTHDLLRIAQKAGIEVNEDQANWLDEISTFHLNARYDNYKREFFKRADETFTLIWLERIKTLRKWLIEKL